MRFVVRDGINRIKNDELIGSGLIFLVGSLSVAVLNYFYQIVMGRMLGPYEYGVLGSLFAMIYLTTFAGNTFSRVMSKYSAEYRGRERNGALKYIIKRGIFKVSFYGFLVFVVYLFFIPTLARFMNLDSYIGLFLVGFIGYVSVVSSVVVGSLNGLEKFVWQNSLSFVSAFLKISLAVLLVYIGFGVSGALISIVIGSLVVLFFGIMPLKRELRFDKIEKVNTKNIYLYAIPVLIASVLPLIAITIDQILVKHLFSSVSAGHYAAAGNIAKIIWFGSGFLVSAIFPKIVSYRAKGRDSSGLLIKGLVYTSFFALIGSGVLMATPRLIVLVMYGAEYLDIVSFVGLFGLALGLFSINQLLIGYNLAIERYSFLWIVFLGVVFQMVGILVFHSVLSDIVKITLLSQTFILIGMLIYNKGELFKNGFR
jgi:O-antigen/teichoic acid export membrane protein